MSEAQADGDDGASIAIIGMAGRFPGASTPERFWANLASGHEAVRFFDDEELLAAGETPHALEDPNYVKAWPVLEGIARAKAAGIYKGRKPSVDRAKVRELRQSGMPPSAIAKELKIGRASVYRALGAD